MQEQNKYKRLGENTIYTFIGNVGPQFVSFLLVPFYTFWLTKEDYGIQDIILTYIVFIIPYLSLGLYEALFLFPKDKPMEEQRKYFTTAINVVTLVSITVVGIWVALPDSVHEALLPGRMRDYEIYFIIAILSGPYQRMMQYFARSLNKMKVYSITGVIHALIVLFISLTFVPHYGLKGFFISFLSAQIISTTYTFIGIKGWNFYKLHNFDRSFLSEMLKYSLPLVPNATMWWIVNSINRPIMLKTVALDDIGIYAVAGKFPAIINILFTVFYSALQISVIEEFGKKNYSTFYNNVFRIILLSLLAIVFFFILLGDYIFKIIVDQEFFSAAFYVPILCFGAVIASLSAYIGTTFTVLKKTIYFLYSSIIAAVVAVVANLLLIPEYGLMGACLAVCISQLSMFLYRWYKSYKYVNFEDGKRLLCITIITIGSLIVYYFIGYSPFKLVILIALFIALLVSNMDLIRIAKGRIIPIVQEKRNH